MICPAPERRKLYHEHQFAWEKKKPAYADNLVALKIYLTILGLSAILMVGVALQAS